MHTYRYMPQDGGIPDMRRGCKYVPGALYRMEEPDDPELVQLPDPPTTQVSEEIRKRRRARKEG